MMADFFTRLAERTLGLALTAQPVITPMFAPEPGLGDNAPLENTLDEKLPNESIAEGYALVSELYPEQTPVPMQPQPPSEQKAEASIERIRTSPTQVLNFGSTRSLSNQVISIHQAESEVPADTSAFMNNQKQKVLVEHLQDQNATHQILMTHERHVEVPLQEHVPHPTGAMSSLAAPIKTPSAQSPQRQPEQGRLRTGDDAPIPNSSADARFIATSTPFSTRSSDERGTLIPPVSSSPSGRETLVPPISTVSGMKKPTRAVQPVRGREVPLPSTPTVQVTIGRIEVRATPAPTPAEPSVGARVTTPPLMSLDDYLQQRAKGGRS